MDQQLAYARCAAYATQGRMYDPPAARLTDAEQRRVYRECYLTLTGEQRRNIDNMHEHLAGVQVHGRDWRLDERARHQIRTRVASAIGNITPASEIRSHDREQHHQTPAERRSAGARAGQDPGEDDPHRPEAVTHATPELLQARIRKNINPTLRARLIEEFISGVLGAAPAGPLYVRVYHGDEISEPDVDLLLVVHAGEPLGGGAS